jgi:hypothetical protein
MNLISIPPILRILLETQHNLQQHSHINTHFIPFQQYKKKDYVDSFFFFSQLNDSHTKELFY